MEGEQARCVNVPLRKVQPNVPFTGTNGTFGVNLRKVQPNVPFTGTNGTFEKGTTKLHAHPLTTFTLFTPFVGTKFLFFYIFFYKKYLQIKIEITI